MQGCTPRRRAACQDVCVVYLTVCLAAGLFARANSLSAAGLVGPGLRGGKPSPAPAPNDPPTLLSAGYGHGSTQTLWQRLTYHGKLIDVVINYSLIALLLAPLRTLPASVAAALVACSVALQVQIWKAVPDSYGVSLVWSSLGGVASVLEFASRHSAGGGLGFDCHKESRSRGLLCGMLGMVYYMFTYPPITTVAHAAALALGATWGAVVVGVLQWKRTQHGRD
jgi:hypothetical protein